MTKRRQCSLRRHSGAWAIAREPGTHEHRRMKGAHQPLSLNFQPSVSMDSGFGLEAAPE